MSDYVAVRAGGWRWKVSEAWREFPFGKFEDLLGSARPVKDLNIKRTVEVRADGRDFLVKIYKGRGAFHRLKAALLGSRAGRELDALVGAVERGVPTLPFVAVGERGAESCVIILKEPDRERLDLLLARSRNRRALIAEYGRWARRVHDAGIDQADFNPTNVLAKSGRDPDLRLIDFEKVRIARALSETARLKSLAKIDRMIPASRADRLRFFESYLGEESRDRKGLRLRAAKLLGYADDVRARDAARRREACVKEGRNFAKFREGDAWGWYRRDLVSPVALASGVGRRVAVERALDAWRRANGSVTGELPAAVVLTRGSPGGYLVYPARGD